MPNPNALSERYVTPKINKIFSKRWKIIAERNLWIMVMKAQRDLGLDIPSEDIEKFERAKGDINPKLIKGIERRTQQDVKARIEAFIQVANAGQYIHMGMTSRDLTDNVEQVQIRDASKIIFGKNVSTLRHMLDKAAEYSNCLICARTHNQPAQPTSLGRRFSMWAEELLTHLNGFEEFVQGLALRGIKGPVGTQFDMRSLLGDKRKVEELERIVSEQLGFSKLLNSPGQVYPRSFDYALINHLAQLGSASENFAETIRIMAGAGLVNEGFEEGQTGSSAMPYKMNTRTCERICSLAELLKMYADGASRISGDQWMEGDVSCSVLRRVIIPDAFYASDGLCENVLTVLNNIKVYEDEIFSELKKYLPFMATTEILQRAVKAGVGREDAHKAIKRLAIDETERMRRGNYDYNRLPELIASEPIFADVGITREEIDKMLSEPSHFLGNASVQIEAVRNSASPLLSKYSKEVKYEPEAIL